MAKGKEQLQNWVIATIKVIAIAAVVLLLLDLHDMCCCFQIMEEADQLLMATLGHLGLKLPDAKVSSTMTNWFANACRGMIAL